MTVPHQSYEDRWLQRRFDQGYAAASREALFAVGRDRGAHRRVTVKLAFWALVEDGASPKHEDELSELLGDAYDAGDAEVLA